MPIAVEVETGGIAFGAQTLGVGDEIVTTRNDRRLVTTTGAWVRNGDRWTVDQRHQDGALQLRSLDGRGSVTVPDDYVHEHVGLAYAVTVHRSQGLTLDQAVLVVDRSTSTEHLYVAMTRGRHHNLACVITEPAGDEHTQRPAPTAEEVLAGVLRRSSAEKSATETLQDELQSLQPEAPSDPRDAIIDGLRQAQRHSYQQTVRRLTQRQTHPFPGHGPAPSVIADGPEL